MVFTGARISEVLALTPRLIDLDEGTIVIRTLKKRRKCGRSAIYRAIPVPSTVISELDAVHRIRDAKKDLDRIDQRIWPWCRTTAWKRIKDIMRDADISGVQAVPKGLRHGYAIGALCEGVSDISVMRLLGHSRLETTKIYSEALEAEGRIIARKIWAPLLQDD